MIRLYFIIPFFITTTLYAAPKEYFELNSSVELLTGDSWITEQKRYRLFGVQTCPEGNLFTDNSGVKKDCGEASRAVLSAFIHDSSPLCTIVAKAKDQNFVICYAKIGQTWLDLGSILITAGFAVAALKADGEPYYPAYAAAQYLARIKRSGLWQFFNEQRNVTHPTP